MNLTTIKKLLASDETEEGYIAIERRSANQILGHVEELHAMLLGTEAAEITEQELKELLIRLCPDAKNVFRSSASVPSVMNIVAKHVFLTGAGDPRDIAIFRHSLKTLQETGKIPVKH